MAVAASGHSQRAAPVEPARPGCREHVQRERQHERTGVELEGEPDPEQHARHGAAEGEGALGAPAVHDEHRRDRAGHDGQVPVVERVEHQWRAERPQQRAPAREAAQHPAGSQPERGHQERGAEQELRVVVGEQRPGPDQQAGEHRVLDGATDQLPVRRDRAREVREDVLVDVAPEPQVLDVGVADVPVDAQLVVGSAASRLVEVRAGAARLVGVAEQQRDAGEERDDGYRHPAGDEDGRARWRDDMLAGDGFHRRARHGSAPAVRAARTASPFTVGAARAGTRCRPPGHRQGSRPRRERPLLRTPPPARRARWCRCRCWRAGRARSRTRRASC